MRYILLILSLLFAGFFGGVGFMCFLIRHWEVKYKIRIPGDLKWLGGWDV